MRPLKSTNEPVSETETDDSLAYGDSFDTDDVIFKLDLKLSRLVATATLLPFSHTAIILNFSRTPAVLILPPRHGPFCVMIDDELTAIYSALLTSLAVTFS